MLPDDGAERDFFGNSVAVSSSTAIVGASGVAYPFDISDRANPVQITKLVAADGGFSFGSHVATSGDTAIVGVPFNSDNGDYSGSAYLFTTGTKGESECQANLRDLAVFAHCKSGPGQPLARCCEPADRDGDADLVDFGIFQDAFGCP